MICFVLGCVCLDDRMTAATNMNAHSSRSHCMLQVRRHAACSIRAPVALRKRDFYTSRALGLTRSFAPICFLCCLCAVCFACLLACRDAPHQIYIKGEDSRNGTTSSAKLSLVDLAGCERISRSGAYIIVHYMTYCHQHAACYCMPWHGVASPGPEQLLLCARARARERLKFTDSTDNCACRRDVCFDN